MTVASHELGELVDIVMGQAPPGSACNKDGNGTVFVKAGEFQERSPIVREWTTQPLKMASPDDTLVCVVGATAGKVNYSAFECAIGRSIAAVKPQRARLDPLFLYQFLQTKVEQLRDRSQGAAQGVITREMLQSLKLALPPLPEQRRIAAILDKADVLRIKRREVLAQLDRLVTSIFFESFGEPSLNTRGWKICRLDELTNKITDGEHINPEFSEHGMPIVMAGNVLENSITLNNAKKVDVHLGQKFRKKCNPEKGDLLMVSRGATIGRMCPVNIDDAFCLMGSVILIKPKKEHIHPAFVTALLKNPAMRSTLYKTSGSSAQQAIYLKDLKNLSCILPPYELQLQFAEKVAQIDKLRLPHSQSIQQFNAFFATLQYRAFKGGLK